MYIVESSGPLSTNTLLKEHIRVFGHGCGLLQGKFHIRLDDGVTPVQHVPRRVPVPLREMLRKLLDDFTKQDIVVPVQQPTPWISTMVIVPEKNGALRIFLDPQDLNRTRPFSGSITHYPPLLMWPLDCAATKY